MKTGFKKFMREKHPLGRPNRSGVIQEGDLVLVTGIDKSSRWLGSPEDYVGQVRVVQFIKRNDDEPDWYGLSDKPGSFQAGHWYLLEDLELVK